MERDDAEMSPPRSEPSRSAPSSPVLPRPSTDQLATPPRVSMPSLPAPPPPFLPFSASPTTPAAASNQDAPSPDHHLLPSFVGTLEACLRSALRQSKWALVLILPKKPPFSSPSSPTRPARPPWGTGSYHQPKKLYACRQIADGVMLWRRTAGSSDADRYRAFFPVDGLPHLALLDPRSGERLAVWGNVDTENMMSHNAISDPLWNVVLDDLKEFLTTHSLDDGALGPAHFREKSWAVRTRRTAQSASSTTLQPTSVMDDEDAAIAAAIAASLSEAERNVPGDDQQSSPSDDDYPADDDSSGDVYSSDGMTPDDEGEPDEQGSTAENENATLSEGSSELDSASMDTSSSTAEPRRSSSMPVPMPSRAREQTPSSLESLSSSYIERMESCLRASTDPALLESRRLRQEQDEQLAKSLQEDRKRIREEELAAAKRAFEKTKQLEAETRLPDEPQEGAKGVFTIALRLPGGVRIARRFNSFDKLISVADFAIAKAGYVEITEKAPTTVLRTPGFKMRSSNWEITLSEIGLSSRTMFILNIE